MRSSKDELIRRFLLVRDIGWVSSHRSNNTGIGKTFEDLMGITENNNPGPDFEEFEIKTQRDETNSPITLFTLAPTFPAKANALIRDRYGVPYADSPRMKKIHTSLFADRKNSYADKYAFKLLNDEEGRCVRIEVYDLHSGILLDNSIGYTYDRIQKKLFQKLTNLFCVNADRRFENGIEEFRFTDAAIYTKPSLERFLSILEDGRIQYDIRIGSYSTGKYAGKPHDHGSGFRLKESYLFDLFDSTENV